MSLRDSPHRNLNNFHGTNSHGRESLASSQKNKHRIAICKGRLMIPTREPLCILNPNNENEILIMGGYHCNNCYIFDIKKDFVREIDVCYEDVFEKLYDGSALLQKVTGTLLGDTKLLFIMGIFSYELEIDGRFYAIFDTNSLEWKHCGNCRWVVSEDDRKQYDSNYIYNASGAVLSDDFINMMYHHAHLNQSAYSRHDIKLHFVGKKWLIICASWFIKIYDLSINNLLNQWVELQKLNIGIDLVDTISARYSVENTPQCVKTVLIKYVYNY